MKGIILAGGLGTRLYPMTRLVSKQLLPIYDKPMIYYPLSTLILAGLKDILVITTPHEQSLFKQLLGDGSQWGINLQYAAQEKPEGIAQAFLIAESFIGSDSVCLILGDNILHGDGLAKKLQEVVKKEMPTIFCYFVSDPERYGVIQFDVNGNAIDIIEKPVSYVSNYAVIGLYFYDNEVINIAKQLKPSLRGELEITDINQYYLKTGKLTIEKMSRGTAWLDTGTHRSLLDAANFISVLEERQGLKIGSPEEAAWRMGFISKTQLHQLATPQEKNGYGQYLVELID